MDSSPTDGQPIDPASPPADAVHTLALTMWSCPDLATTDLSNCTQTTQFDAQQPALLQLKAQRDGAAVVGELIEVATDKGVLIPADGRVLSDESGTAVVRLQASDAEGIVTVQALYADTSATVYGEINAVSVDLALSSSLQEGERLSDGSTLAVMTELSVDGQPYSQPVQVRFASTCSTSGEASIDDTVVAQSGQAIATYKSEGCSEQDVITATLTLGTKVATDTLVIPLANTPVASIQYLSSSPDFLQLDGTGGQSSAIVSFQVLDEVGRPKPGADVVFTLASGADKVTMSPMVARSNADGLVSTTLQAENLPGSVRVQAAVDGASPVIASVSKELSIGTGLPNKRNVSLSFSVHNPEAWHYDGVEVSVNVLAADHFGNWVPDGTAISFITSGGAVEPRCVTQQGGCSVTWRSQDFRPDNARAVVLAFVEGEESFIDQNGNGLFDEGEFDPRFDEHEAFVDANEDGGFDIVEQLIDRNRDGAFNDVDGQYNGILCQGEALSSGACTQDLVDVNASGVIVMSGVSPSVFFCHLDSGDADGDGNNSYDCWDDRTDALWSAGSLEGVSTAMACVVDVASDGTWNPVPVGTSITFSADDPLKTVGRASHEKLSSSAPTYLVSNEGEVLVDWRSSCGAGAYWVSVDTSDGFGTLQVEVETPKSIFTSSSVSITEPTP
ncbi:hypothetical protein [Ferrimonas marina]|uniref:hypothetical protein n=1 Tax=Ferrimonas marina TaxID=299255 RepID=UPI0011610E16|nr:hypothetical protein [Ferrimonas marina]